MAITVTIDDLKITKWTVDVDMQMIEVLFNYLDTEENITKEDKAFFWVTIPETLDPQGNPLPAPDNYYLIPPAYHQILVDLTVDAKGQLMHLINE